MIFKKSAVRIKELEQRIKFLESRGIEEFSDRDVYRRYFEISSNIHSETTLKAQNQIAREVWDTGGDDGIEHKKSHSHWKESKTFSNIFTEWGTRCLGVVKQHPHFCDKRVDYVAAEYGSGGGAVLNALQSLTRELHGFDIAKTNLNECERVLGKKFNPHLVDDELKD